MLAMEVLQIVQKSNNGEARYDAIIYIVLEDLIFSPKLGAKYFLSRALFCKQAKNKKEISCLQSNSSIVSVAEFYQNQRSE